MHSFSILLRNLAYLSRFEGGLEESLIRLAYASVPNWGVGLQSRAWDSTDLLVSLIQSDPSMDFLPFLFEQTDSVGILDLVTRYWNTDCYDPSTSLALLHIAETILLVAPTPREEFQRLMDQATTIVTSLLQHDPSLVASRQYLRWILIKINNETSGKHAPFSRVDPPVGSPGVFLVPNHALCLPLYVPCQSEVPTLLDRKPRADLIPFLKTALDGSRSLGDYETEVMCLQALIRVSEEPTSLYDELAQLQKDTQEDIQGCLQTQLSKYIFCRDQTSRAALREDINNLPCGESFPNLLMWAREMVLRALSTTTAEASLHLTLASSFAAQKDIPTKYRVFMKLAENLQQDRLSTFSGDQTSSRGLKYTKSSRIEVVEPRMYR